MPEQVRNGGFETLGGELFSYWSLALWGGDPSIFNPLSGELVFQVEEVSPISGIRSAKIRITDLDPTAPEWTRALLRQPLSLQPNTEYVLSFKYRGGSTEVSAGRALGIRASIMTEAEMILDETRPPSADPVLVEGLTFTTPEAFTYAILSLEMSYGTRAGEVDFDDVSILPTAPPTEYALTISSAIGGTTQPAPGTYYVVEGSEITVQAFPDEGYVFDYWLLNGATYTENPIRVLMNSDATLEAIFKIIVTYTLTINSEAGGSTNPASGSYVHPETSLVTVTAYPDSGYVFDGWLLNEAVYTQNPITVEMTGDATLIAKFKLVPIPPKPEIPLALILGPILLGGIIILSATR